MKFSKEFKHNWWIAALAVVTIGIILRWESISSGNATDFDTGLLVIIVALALIPLFSEFTFMGLTLKQEIEKTKQDVETNKAELKHEIREMQFSFRNDLRNSMMLSNTSQQIMYNTPPSDIDLEELADQITSTLQKDDPKHRSDDEATKILNSLPTAVQLAFSGRYFIELELRRIWLNVYNNDAPKVLMLVLTRDLRQASVIDRTIERTILELNSVFNPIIHGEPYTSDQVEFIQRVLPPFLGTLQKIEINSFAD